MDAYEILHDGIQQFINQLCDGDRHDYEDQFARSYHTIESIQEWYVLIQRVESMTNRR